MSTISLARAKFGSHVVCYEDLLVDPLSQLREVTSKIVPPDEERLKAAVFLCKPEQLTRVIDPRFLWICLRSKAPRVVKYPKESCWTTTAKEIWSGSSLLEKRLSYW